MKEFMEGIKDIAKTFSRFLITALVLVIVGMILFQLVNTYAAICIENDELLEIPSSLSTILVGLVGLVAGNLWGKKSQAKPEEVEP